MDIGQSLRIFRSSFEEYAVDAETTTGRLNQLFNDTKSTLAKNSTTRSYSRMVHTTQVTSSFNKSSGHNKCLVCSENHQLWSCTDFLGKPVKERLSIASRARLCFNCLKSKSHIAKDCPSQRRCKVNDCRRVATIAYFTTILICLLILQPKKIVKLQVTRPQ